jgi:hypothetical protein
MNYLPEDRQRCLSPTRMALLTTFLTHHEAMACPVTGSRGRGLHAAFARPGTDETGLDLTN